MLTRAKGLCLFTVLAISFFLPIFILQSPELAPDRKFTPHIDSPSMTQENIARSPFSRKEKNDKKTKIGSKVQDLLLSSNNNQHKTRLILQLSSSTPSTQISRIKKRWRSKIRKLNQLEDQKKVRKYEEITEERREEIYELLRKSTQKQRETIKKRIRKINGEIKGEIITINSVIAEIKSTKIPTIKEFPYVNAIYKDEKLDTNLNNADDTLKSSKWWNNGYNGSNYGDGSQGIEVAILDTGINGSHPALQGQVIDAKSFVSDEAAKDLNGHGTHVAGIVASKNTTYQGIGFGSNLLNAKCLDEGGGGYISDIIEAAEWSLTNATDTAEVISSSLHQLFF